MTAFKHGFVDVVCDPEPSKRMMVTPAWIARAELLLGGPGTVRLKLAGDSLDGFPTRLYARGLSEWGHAGWHRNLTVPMEFSRPWLREGGTALHCYPNEPLGYHGDPMLNQYIDEYSLRLCGVLHQLNGLFESVTIWNEPNLNAELATGKNVPPGTGAKPTSISPTNMAALAWTTAARLRDRHYNIQVPLYIGSFSDLGAPFFTNPASDWDGKYVGDGLDFLDAHGKRHMRATDKPYPFDGIALNVEGYYDMGHAVKVRDAFTQVMAKHGWTGPLVVGECGVSGNPDPVLLLETMTALYTNFPDGVCWFQNPFYTPGDPSGYGLQDWSILNGGYYPRGDAKPIVRTLRSAFLSAGSRL